MRNWLVVGVLLLTQSQCARRDDAPIIILITVDSLRWDVLGAYGSEHGLTPNLDKFARQATRFDRAYATSSWTKPSIVSLMTGLLPSQHLVLMSGLKVHLNRAEQFADTDKKQELMQDVNQRLGRLSVVPPHLPMFQEFLSGYARGAFVNNPHLHAQFGFDRGWDSFGFFPSKTFQTGTMYANTPVMNGRIREFLANHKGPKFVWAHFNDVHYPYGPLETYLSRVRKTEVGFDLTRYDMGMHEQLATNADQDTVSLLFDFYAAGLMQFDANLGQLFQELRQRREYDRALILVVADHGEEFMEHGAMGHGNNLYETTFRVPLLVKLPHQNQPFVRGDVVSLIDVGPSILHYANRLDLSPYSGRSAPLVTESRAGKGAVGALLSNDLRHLQTLVLGDEKIVVDVASGHIDLFQIHGDHEVPLENQQRAKALETKLLAVVGQYNFIGLVDQEPHQHSSDPLIDDHMMEQLRALGYVE
ncbi:MAG: sulfatase [Acidobacteria bacterium]|nr:sulfatase [Acidobacteriota bacterium]